MKSTDNSGSIKVAGVAGFCARYFGGGNYGYFNPACVTFGVVDFGKSIAAGVGCGIGCNRCNKTGGQEGVGVEIFACIQGPVVIGVFAVACA